ncbi:MAG: hypothetical protein CME62_00310 [Halobacteriovoraceae bacterium]|nr:hypothetical protein [Halobacteriovoraceae bacterium]|tara:strand:- start:954 stop:3047 length:2094 start_codon:yes stop_codon:yes gene_type:complete
MILKPQRNCIQIDRNSHYKLLVDGENYFEQLYKILPEAKSSIYIHAWEVDSKLRLKRDHNHDVELKNYLFSLVDKNPELNIYIICWDFSFVFFFERELFLKWKLDYLNHERIHFCYNTKHKLGGSNHQKFVVIDDEIVFLGGMDVTKRRFDSRDHEPGSDLRVDPRGHRYGPFHDVQVMIAGESAKTVADIFREDWLDLMGERLEEPKKKLKWPPDLAGDIHGELRGAISRSGVLGQSQDITKENLELYLDCIQNAKHYMYFESQYLTSADFVEALAQKLEANTEGVEVILVISNDWSGYFEERILGAISQRNLKRLLEADKYKKLQLVTPCIHRDGKKHFIKVHSKISIIDDVFIRVGSSNLNERSLHLDSEIDFSLEAQNPIQRMQIKKLLHDLLAEHTGVSLEEVSKKLNDLSLCEYIEKNQLNSRALVKIKRFTESSAVYLAPFKFIADPKMSITHFLKSNLIQFYGQVKQPKMLMVILGILLGLFLINHFSLFEQLRNYTQGEFLAAKSEGTLFTYGILIFGLSSFLGLPLNAMIPIVAMSIPGIEAFFICMMGSLLSSTAGYFLGRGVGTKLIPHQAKAKVDRASRILEGKGVVTVFLTRSLPVAPFIIINMVSGALKIKFHHYILGTFLGLLPGLTIFTFFGHEFQKMSQDFSWSSVMLSFCMLVFLILLSFYLKSVFKFKQGFDGVQKA